MLYGLGQSNYQGSPIDTAKTKRYQAKPNRQQEVGLFMNSDFFGLTLKATVKSGLFVLV
jgi:hypothetical protein